MFDIQDSFICMILYGLQHSYICILIQESFNCTKISNNIFMFGFKSKFGVFFCRNSLIVMCCLTSFTYFAIHITYKTKLGIRYAFHVELSALDGNHRRFIRAFSDFRQLLSDFIAPVKSFSHLQLINMFYIKTFWLY